MQEYSSDLNVKRDASKATEPRPRIDTKEVVLHPAPAKPKQLWSSLGWMLLSDTKEAWTLNLPALALRARPALTA
ncbi:hypothetical protein EVAR_55434_1 [Eumeta japonica]|uniref:Uncharacterized protein n=1 Tax=Eumeta variegata TaxID=151549 RepID=A0A4C1Y6Q5_EUMVA|nr:hypothetical protein EVAR_55434_1 [Eumeta japonica]